MISCPRQARSAIRESPTISILVKTEIEKARASRSRIPAVPGTCPSRETGRVYSTPLISRIRRQPPENIPYRP